VGGLAFVSLSAAFATASCELEKLLRQLPHEPIMIPLRSGDKRPDTVISWKDPQCHLTAAQALDRLRSGGNVGIVAHDWLCIFDLDDPKRYTFPKETLTVKTRSGALHKYFLNDGTVENAVGKNSLAKCGEVRADWQYVVAPGSYVPPDQGSTVEGNGLYHIVNEVPPVTLSRSELPGDFVTNITTKIVPKEHINPQITIRNRKGTSIDDLRKIDPELDQLLNGNDTKYQDDTSKADMATMTLLYHTYQFDEIDTLAAMKKYRYRPKLDRADYLSNTMEKIKQNPPANNILQPNFLSKLAKITYPQGIQQTLIQDDTKTTTVIQKTDNKQCNIGALIKALKTDFKFKTPEDTRELYFYDQGIYRSAETFIESLLETVLQEKLSSHFAKEIIDHLKRGTYTPREEFNRYVDCIPVQNGLLNLKTCELREYDPNVIFTFKLHLIYDSQADCPRFKQWLSEVQTPENILILQEYAGYTLLPEMPFHKALLLIGEGRNGKSTYLQTIESIIGRQNTSHIDLQALVSDNRFVTANLYSKLANISSEPETKKQLQTSVFKQITGGDTISAEIKNQQKRLNFVNYAKLYFSGNSYPKVLDSSTAFKQRIMLVKWEKQFLEGQGQIQNIEKNWTTNEQERSGILNWMLQGLQRLLANGKFTTSKSQDQIMIEYERGSDSISAWLHERVVFNFGKQLDKEIVYNDYATYCEHYNIYKADVSRFNGKLRNVHNIEEKRVRVFNSQVRFWLGIELKPSLEPIEELENQSTKQPQPPQFVPHCEESQQKVEVQSHIVPTVPGVPPFFYQKNDNIRLLEKENGGTLGITRHSQPVDHAFVDEQGVKLIEALGRQPVCCFCGALIEDSTWAEGPVSFDNPAHVKCYRDEQEKKKQREASL